jgi:poly-gamma-glutamate synthase PgsB/CapB
MLLLVSASLLLVILALVESFRLQAGIRRIPIRIHVNGTRGKSSVTRLIAAGLRAGGYRVIAKTTGTVPRLILEDGSETSLPRRGRATIREQRDVLMLAAARQADAVVLECMAIHPELQWVSEHRMLRSTIGVITNVREDHQEVLGFDTTAAARSLAATIPAGALLVTADPGHAPLFREVGTRLGTRVVLVTAADAGDRTGDALEPGENLALALRVCDEVGVDRRRAVAGMRAAAPDVGALRLVPTSVAGVPVRFLNAFALNDVDSLSLVWRSLTERDLVKAPVVVLLNGRDDRPRRSLRFGQVVAKELRPERLVLTGGGWHFARRGAVSSGYPAERIHRLAGPTARDILAGLSGLLPPGALILGAGNYAGAGRAIAEALEQPCSLKPSA